jgi:hypothetical protein
MGAMRIRLPDTGQSPVAERRPITALGNYQAGSRAQVAAAGQMAGVTIPVKPMRAGNGLIHQAALRRMAAVTGRQARVEMADTGLVVPPGAETARAATLRTECRSAPPGGDALLPTVANGPSAVGRRVTGSKLKEPAETLGVVPTAKASRDMASATRG